MAPLVIAHRTCPRDAPENSLEGIVTASELGADVVEIDVRRTSDGRPMLLHDRWLVRTTGWPLRLEWVPEARVRRIRQRGGGTVPTLADGLAALPPGLRVAIDVKDAGAADAVIAEVRNQRIEDRTLFWSQHETAVRTAARLAPELEIALLRDTTGPDELDRFLADTADFGARAISARWAEVGPELAERCAEAGFKLYAWCRTETIDHDRLALIDGLVTDWPAVGRAQVQALG